MLDYTTPRAVNKALVKAGLNAHCYRGEGYYYFTSETMEIDSIYCWPRLYGTTDSIVQHVRDELARIAR